MNAIATGESFRPLEGDGERSENRFMRREADGILYYAVFNYSREPLAETIPFERLALDPSGAYGAIELWSGAAVDPKAIFTIPSKDVALFKIAAK